MLNDFIILADANANADPAKAAQDFRTARFLGVDYGLVKESPEAQSLAKSKRFHDSLIEAFGGQTAFDPSVDQGEIAASIRARGNNGDLYRWIMSQPEHADLLQPEDIQHMQGASGHWRAMKQAWKTGDDNAEMANLSMKEVRHMMQPDSMPELDAKDAARLAELKALPHFKYGKGFIRGALASTAESLPLMGQGIKEGLALGAAGAAVGSIAPGIGTAAGFTAAAGGGMFHGTQVMEAGLAYQEYLDAIRQKQGREPTREEKALAAHAAFNVGTGNAAMELIPMGIVAHNMPGVRQGVRSLVGLVADKPAAGFGLNVAKAAGGTLAVALSEAGTETLQEANTIRGRNDLGAAEAVSDEEKWERLKESAIAGFGMGFIMNLPSAGLHIMHSAATATQSALDFAEITDKTAKAPIAKALPEKLAEGLKAGGMTDDISIDAEVLVASLKQSGYTPEKIETAIPGLSKKIEDAIETGGDVTFSAADAIAHFGAQDPALKDVLARHGKLGGNLLSAEEAQSPEFAKLMEEAIKSNQETAKADAEQSSQADKLEAHWVSMADKVGQSGPGRAVAKVMRHLFTTASEITGESIDKLASMIPVTADKAKFGTVSSSMIPKDAQPGQMTGDFKVGNSIYFKPTKNDRTAKKGQIQDDHGDGTYTVSYDGRTFTVKEDELMTPKSVDGRRAFEAEFANLDEDAKAVAKEANRQFLHEMKKHPGLYDFRGEGTTTGTRQRIIDQNAARSGLRETEKALGLPEFELDSALNRAKHLDALREWTKANPFEAPAETAQEDAGEVFGQIEEDGFIELDALVDESANPDLADDWGDAEATTDDQGDIHFNLEEEAQEEAQPEPAVTAIPEAQVEEVAEPEAPADDTQADLTQPEDTQTAQETAKTDPVAEDATKKPAKAGQKKGKKTLETVEKLQKYDIYTEAEKAADAAFKTMVSTMSATEVHGVKLTPNMSMNQIINALRESTSFKEAIHAQFNTKLADVGEKIGGARKDVWQASADKYGDALPSDIAKLSLSEHLPDLDYQKLAASGVSLKVLAACKVMRDAVGPKPRVSFRVRRWAEELKTARVGIKEMLENHATAAANFEKPVHMISQKAYLAPIEILAAVGPELMSKVKPIKAEVSQAIVNGKTQAPSVYIYTDSLKSKASGWSFGNDNGIEFTSAEDIAAKIIAKITAAQEKKAAEPDKPASAKEKALSVYFMPDRGVYIIAHPVTSKKQVILREFVPKAPYPTGKATAEERRAYAEAKDATRSEVVAYFRDNKAMLLSELEERLKPFQERPDTPNAPRAGIARRTGDISPEVFAQTFGFRGVEFGNWATQAERQDHVNAAYDGLMDLAEVMKVPPRALTLNGELAIAFGARGKGGKGAAMAHYESVRTVINLTKEFGAGALAHEWFHALDNYFARMGGESGYVTEDKRDQFSYGGKVRREVLEAFNGIIDAIKATGMPKRSKEQDAKKAKDYWSTNLEMAARAFESFVVSDLQAKGIGNDYLARFSSTMDEASIDNPYPLPSEQGKIDAAFRQFAATLKTEEKDGRVRLYQSSAPLGAFDILPTGETVIRMFRNANRSTFLHESGHFMFEFYGRLAMRFADKTEVIKNWQALLKFAGIRSDIHLSEINAAVADPEHPEHAAMVEALEKGARAWEAYFMEGKAPVKELRSVFRRFLGWLTKVYQSIAGLRVELTPEIRQAFDRIIVGQRRLDEEQAITAAILTPEALKKLAGEGEEERKMDDARQLSQAEAEDLMRAKLLSGLSLASNDERYKEVAADARAQARKEVEAMPIYQAMKALSHGEKLNGVDLKRVFGPAVLKALPATVPPIHAKDGTADADQVAQDHGFPDAKALVHSLIKAEPFGKAVDRKTEELILIHYGDPLAENRNQSEVDAIAALANHQDKRGSLLVLELNAIMKKLDPNAPPPDISLKIAENTAKSMLEGMPVKDAGKWQNFRRAESKAGHAATKAILAGKWADAAKFKRAQLAQYALSRESLRISEMTEARLSRMKRHGEMKTIHRDYKQQIDNLLAAFKIAKKKGNGVTLAQFLQLEADQQKDIGLEKSAPVQIPADLILADLAQVSPWQDCTDSDLADLDSAITALARVGRAKQKAESKEAQEAFDADMAEITGKILEHAPAALSDEAQAKQDGSGRGKVASFILSTWEATRSVRERMRQIDGDGVAGPFAKLVWNAIADAQAKEYDMQAQANERLMARFDALPPEQRKKLRDSVTIPEGAGTYWASKTREELIAAALNTGNKGNLDKMLRGEPGLNAEILDAALANLTAEEWQLVQGIWDDIDLFWPQIEAMYTELKGAPPPRVKPVPMTVRARNHAGEIVELNLRGGYYPVKYDMSRDKSGRQHDLGDSLIARMMDGNPTRNPKTANGYSNERTAAAYPIDLRLNVVAEHIAEVTHDLAFHRPLLAAHKIIKDQRFRIAYSQRFSEEAYQQLPHWLKDIANDRIKPSGMSGVENFFRGVRKHVTFMALGYKLSTALIQTSGIATTMSRVGMTPVIRAFASFLKSPDSIIARYEEIKAMSGEMRHRHLVLDRDIRHTIDNSMTGESGLHKFRRWGFVPIREIDRIVTTLAWEAGYAKAKADGRRHEDAIRYADHVVNDQGSGAPKELAAFFRGSEGYRMLSMFMGPMNAIFNRLMATSDEFRIAWREQRTREVLPALIIRTAFLTVIPAVLGELILGRTPDDDEDLKEWAATKSLLYAVGGLPVVRDVANASLSNYPERGSTAVQVANEALNAVDAAWDMMFADDPQPALENAADIGDGAGYVLGLPISTATRMMRNIERAAGDEPLNIKDLLQTRKN